MKSQVPSNILKRIVLAGTGTKPKITKSNKQISDLKLRILAKVVFMMSKEK